MMMQIYADVTNKPIKIAQTSQACAVGSAIFASVAAGKKNGGYDTLSEACKRIAKYLDKVYIPIEENVKVYQKLYKEYKTLHNYFGEGGNDIMKRMMKGELKK